MTPEELARRAMDRGLLSARDVLDAHADPAPGASDLSKRYELLQRVGVGASGEVWRARDRHTGGIVAVKRVRLLAGHLRSPADLRARFQRELDALVRFRHPGIPAVFEAGYADGYGLYAMEFVEGVPLDSFVDQRSLPIADRVRLVEDSARIVQYAHAHGFVHRDLKPSNILVDAGMEGAPRPRIVDFGLAKDLEAEGDLTSAGAAMGTPHYMSPEQANGHSRDVDARSDVFSLGAVLYRLLAGHPPFEAANVADVLRLVSKADVRPLRECNPSVPSEVSDTVARAMRLTPSERFPTAEAFAEALRAWREKGPARACPQGRAHRGLPTRRAAALTLACGAIAVLIGVLLAPRDRRVSETPPASPAPPAAPAVPAAPAAPVAQAPAPPTEREIQDALARWDRLLPVRVDGSGAERDHALDGCLPLIRRLADGEVPSAPIGRLRADLALLQGNAGEALVGYQERLQEHPTDLTARVGRALALMYLERDDPDDEKARQAASECLGSDPGSPMAVFTFWRVHERVRRKLESLGGPALPTRVDALSRMQEAVSHGVTEHPDDPICRSVLAQACLAFGDALAAAGQRGPAADRWRMARQIDPSLAREAARRLGEHD